MTHVVSSDEPPSLDEQQGCMGVFPARNGNLSVVAEDAYAAAAASDSVSAADTQPPAVSAKKTHVKKHLSTSHTHRKRKTVYRRSKQGCLTCKLRKKRCDEQKPICGDCLRLHRRCEYITDDMTPEQIRKLKHEMEIIEEESKLRRRKRKTPKTHTNATADAHAPSAKRLKGAAHGHKQNGKRVVFNPLSIDIPSVANRNWLQGMGATLESLGYMTGNTGYCEELPVEATQSMITPASTSSAPSASAPSASAPSASAPSTTGFSVAVPSTAASSTYPMSALASFTDQPPDNSSTTASAGQQATFDGTPFGGFESETSGPSELFSPDFTRAIMQHFKQDSGEDTANVSVPGSTQMSPTSSTIRQLRDVFRLSPRSADHSNENSDDVNKTNSNVIKDDDKKDDNGQISDIQIERIQRPQIYMNPSIVRSSTLASLTPVGKKLYEYYRDKLSLIVSSAPKEENMYRNTFLPMAHVDKSVLFGILAWSAFHLGGTKMEKQGNYYIQKAIEGFTEKPIVDEDTIDYYKDVSTKVDDDDEDIVRETDETEGSESSITSLSNDRNLQMLSRDDIINLRLASFLILCGVEICRGDVSRWSKYLEYGARLIRLKGGLQTFNGSKDEHFLATNYAYHDITAVALSKVRPLHFDLKDYERMWTASNELGFLDPLHNISSPIFSILAEINKLVWSSRRLYRKIRNARSFEEGKVDDSDDEQFLAHAAEELAGAADGYNAGISESGSSSSNICLSPEMQRLDREMTGKQQTASVAHSSPMSPSTSSSSSSLASDDSLYSKYNQIMLQCQELENKLNNARPRRDILMRLKPKDLELQLTVFECFQLTAKIHLRQSVLRMTPSSLEIQYLVNQLIKSLDILLGTDVEAALCFPMFIAGMNVIYPMDRKEMNQRYNDFIRRYRWKNVLRCQIVMKQLWRWNPLGDRFVDWYDVVERLGWKLSFA